MLDWVMPGIDGLEVARRIRAASSGETPSPILMLTACDAVEDRIEALDSGADDYLAQPFAPAELLARIRTLWRRPQPGREGPVLRYADLVLDPVTRETRRSDRSFDLSPKDFDLLRQPRPVLARESILQEFWGYDFGNEGNVLDVYIGYLRTKTESGGEPRLIQTVRGVGYTLREG